MTIGEFAARCGLSAKMLRSYAAAGLLTPTAVDAWSGYRYYSAGQLPTARVIGLLRKAEIPIDDIASLLTDPDGLLLERWDRDIVQASAARRQALADARAALGRPPRLTPSIQGARGTDMTGTFVAGTATHQGGRDSNQDAALVDDTLFAVADGIGAFAAGEVASRLAADSLNAAFVNDRSISGLLAACREANDAVWQHAHRRETTMGTTIAALAITDDTGAVAVHVGDSRLYRSRDGRIEQLTRDHTVVADLIRTGRITEQDAQDHPHRNVLTQALGVGPDFDLDYAGVSCKTGDKLLLCTDGLVKALSTEEINDVLTTSADPGDSADRLVNDAVRREAQDNVTAVVIDVR